MKIGDVVKIKDTGEIGMIMGEKRKHFMVGFLVEVLVNNTIKKVLVDSLEAVDES